MKPKILDSQFYHGTSSQIQIGDYLVPTARSLARYRKSRVFITDSIDAALFYAKKNAEKHGGDPVIYKVEPDYFSISKISKTDYVTTNAKVVGVINLDEIKQDEDNKDQKDETKAD